ncbi:hypothetical protein GALMADRAFT_107537 [Galerina marginata CBS 339.88]|uniref:Inner centromere protein ARK-binding domain-containing protein n=1 Tax=Galerina marginata (strain CBS 339.88) TaxID=685588 RepID=A0A067TYD4_GALM3|nr:hypothetical protein GALMADRAFT_107537 [Galerina marginata CBS 339.88]
MAQPGLLSWANSICLTMASDPGRQVFKEQVQTHGFLFLDDYLDNIVSGAKQDPLIELVKTPGRKKAVARKPKLTSSKLGNIVSLSFEGHSDNENRTPPSDFQASLLVVKANEHCDAKNKTNNTMTEEQKGPARPPLVSIQPVNDVSSSLQDQSVPSTVATPVGNLAAEVMLNNAEHSNDLSIIAEDDEPSERSNVSSSGLMEAVTKDPLPITLDEPKTSSAAEQGHNASQQDMETMSTSLGTFHYVPLHSPTVTNPREIQPLATPSHPQKQDESLKDDLHTESPPSHSNGVEDYAMADFQDDPLQIDRKSTDKPVAPSFPTLPEPMPLRKSMKPPRDPSLNVIMMGAATPGAPVGGKRTSWLMKAREVKALEGTTKKSSVHAINFLSTIPSVPHGTKRKSEDMRSVPQADLEDEERQLKVAKTLDGEVAPRKSKDVQGEKKERQQQPPTAATPQLEVREDEESVQEGVLDRLKKTVEGLGARVSKTMGKSLGGANAATALAEARAAAEARVAERDRMEEEKTMALGVPSTGSGIPQGTDVVMSPPQHNDGRLSISDLFPTDSRVKEKHKAPEKPFQFKTNAGLASTDQSKRESTSTTPPNSPPQVGQPSIVNKHTPVFVPPVAAPTKAAPSTSTQYPVFNPPPMLSTNLTSATPSTSLTSISLQANSAVPLTTHSTLESVQSEEIFDRDDVSAWMPSTQETEYTTYGSQSQPQNPQICDEDDSWPMDEKLAAGVQWTFGASKEDSMTWSTLPSQSQRADTGPVTKTSPIRKERSELHSPNKSHQIPGAFDLEMDDEGEVLMNGDSELEEIILGASKSTTNAVEAKAPPRSQSQMSMASSESSQSQVGFLGQASKLLSSALGTNKKKQPEVKMVLQKAAVAAKKQQEEADKKAARLKEMESRRQQALQRKAEEEKARALEEERKMKEDAERRKREREGNTEKRALKLPSAKKDDDTQKKRKIEVEKKQELKKPGPSMLFGKSHLKTAIKQPANLNSLAYGSLAHAALTSNLEAESSTLHKGKDQAHQQSMHEDEVSRPSQLLQSQMAARAKAQINAAKQIEPPVPSESIELPDINSEYSDSDDEDRVRTFDPPDWAQSPELRQALAMQSTINPDDIFGAVRPLKMEEIFKTRTSRFRARTSSANWTGTDRLTIQEEKDYARRMGFK